LSCRVKSLSFQELQREVQTNRNLYDTFFTRIKQANDSLELQTANARIIDSAVTPSSPFKPRKALLVSLALVLSLMFGGFVGIYAWIIWILPLKALKTLKIS
jgi:succinoglycan biosynthesis transport protein ExoP